MVMVAPNENLLRCSFQHLPGISASREERLWARGIMDWADVNRASPTQPDLYEQRANSLQLALQASEEALANRDIAFFASRLPKREYFRIASSFPESCVFLDIETTGLSKYYDKVTVLGWSLGDTYTAVIEPTDIETLKVDIREHPIIVTFNGSLFDLPFLTKCFKADWSEIYHIDLRYLARRVGLKGGQKKIETEIGLNRDSGLEEIDGAEAVALWFDYKEGDLNALKQLVRYNHADIEGMKSLFEEAVQRLSSQKSEQLWRGNLFKRSRIQFSDTRCGNTERTVSVHPYRGNVGPRLTFEHLHNDEIRLKDATIIGIDLTGSERRQSGWAAATGQHLTMSLVASDEEIVERTLAAEPFLVSIDSPLSLPAGRSSEFDDDPGREEYGIVREAERQLRKRGVHVYPALLPSMQRLTQRGIKLAARFRKSGIPVIESYPGAAQDILGIPRKKTSLKHLVQGLRRFGYNGLTSGDKISHDELDAATSALVGQFMLAGYWEALGSTEEDYLIVPTVDRRPLEYRPLIAVGLSGPIAAGKTTAAKIMERLGFRYCRFSQVIEQEIQRCGTPVTRASLQAFGERAYNSRFGQRQIQNSVAAYVEPAQRIVIDGLRHPEDSAYLRERWGMAAFHIHIDSSNDLRARRFAAKTGESKHAFHTAETHTVERNAYNMREFAEIIVNNTLSTGHLENSIKEAISGAWKCPSVL